MSKSILQSNEEECYLCGRQWGLECHHIYAGVANRKISEAQGFKVMLCHKCHTGDGNNSAQYDKDLSLRLKRECQAKFEETHTRDEFRKLIGKSYL